MRLGIVAAAVLVGSTLTASVAGRPAPPRLVANSRLPEPPLTIALVNPHYPVNLAPDAAALAADVNASRAEHGLEALRRDETLDRFAYAKAVEMAARGYFGHTDPDGITFHDRMTAWHWPTPYAAENIAFDRDEQLAHAAFMHSPPHAQNVLDPHERKIGVAVVSVGGGETFYVEDFSGN